MSARRLKFISETQSSALFRVQTDWLYVRWRTESTSALRVGSPNGGAARLGTLALAGRSICSSRTGGNLHEPESGTREAKLAAQRICGRRHERAEGPAWQKGCGEDAKQAQQGERC